MISAYVGSSRRSSSTSVWPSSVALEPDSASSGSTFTSNSRALMIRKQTVSGSTASSIGSSASSPGRSFAAMPPSVRFRTLNDPEARQFQPSGLPNCHISALLWLADQRSPEMQMQVAMPNLKPEGDSMPDMPIFDLPLLEGTAESLAGYGEVVADP